MLTLTWQHAHNSNKAARNTHLCNFKEPFENFTKTSVVIKFGGKPDYVKLPSAICNTIVVLIGRIADKLFMLYFSFCSKRKLPMKRYKSTPRIQTQELQWKQFMSLPAFPQTPLLPHNITLTPAFKTAQVELVGTHFPQWTTTTNVPTTQLSRYIIWSTSPEQFSLHSFFDLILSKFKLGFRG